MSADTPNLDRALHLIYHSFTPSKVPYTYTLSTDQFRGHLEVLQQSRDRLAYKGRVTFDDGHRSQFEYAAPLLAEFKVKAIFFITSGWTGSHEDSMDSSQLREIAAAGHAIGAHGLTHKLLTHCSNEELEQEIAGSKKALEDSIGRPVDCFSMPGGRYNRRVLEACRQAGYKEVFTSDPTVRVNETCGIRTIGRYNVQQSLTPEALTRLLDPDSGVLRREQWKANVKRIAQRIIGDELYFKLWSTISRADRVD